jgi:HTH-type transcriptional regulator / antitoxin HigA
MERVTIKPIHGPEEHAAALTVIGNIMALEAPDESELAMLETLAVLVERYEEKIFPLYRPTPLQAIRFRMDQMDLNQSQLSLLTGLPKSRVSEVLNGKRALSLEMIRVLHEKLGIPTDILISREPEPSASS